MYKIVLSLLLVIAIGTGCSVSASTSANDFDTQAIEMVKMIDKRMQKNEDLTEDEQYKLKMFTAKYATESQKERKSYLTTMVVALYTTNVSILLSDTTGEELEYMQKYNKIFEELKTELNM